MHQTNYTPRKRRGTPLVGPRRLGRTNEDGGAFSAVFVFCDTFSYLLLIGGNHQVPADHDVAHGGLPAKRVQDQ
ncbi:hypothetical protein KIPB_016327, partial [Kipferlia bialata]|eukprot:g16327.t1